MTEGQLHSFGPKQVGYLFNGKNTDPRHMTEVSKSKGGRMSYLKNAPGRLMTPQSQPIPDEDQVLNSAGGYVYEITPLQQLRRFLILGTEGGTYYASQSELTVRNTQIFSKVDPKEAIKLIVEVSDQGLAPKNDPALYALAFYAASKDSTVKNAAFAALPKVARTSTHLFMFLTFAQANRGWGRSMRRAIGNWYETQDPQDLAFQAVKYRQRDGWSHRDVLRKSHPAGATDEHKGLYDWITHGTDEDVPEVVHAFLEAQNASSPHATARLIRAYRLPREAVKTEHLTDPEVWAALVEARMPMTALIRNLPTMTRVGLLDSQSYLDRVTEQLQDTDSLKGGRIHPLQLLAAMLTYKAGYSIRGSNTWTPKSVIVDALDEAFYRSFDFVRPTGQRYLLALDVSGSMNMGTLNGVPGLTPRVGSVAMAMVTARAGDPYEVIAFTSAGYGGLRATGTAITQVDFSPRRRLDDLCREMSRMPFGGTDCALPMLYADQYKKEFDVFSVYTDNETWAGRVHPSQALRQYRRSSGRAARLAVVGMTATSFSIADPNDAGMLDVVGFDSSAPRLISEFAQGRI